MSNKVRRVLSNRFRIGVLVMIVGCFSGTAFTNRASAAMAPGWMITYYTDATFTVECGWAETCFGLSDGCFTLYRSRRAIDCQWTAKNQTSDRK